MILSVAMLLEWLGKNRNRDGFSKAGAAIHHAVEATLANAATRTADIGGRIGFKAFTQCVVNAIALEKRNRGGHVNPSSIPPTSRLRHSPACCWPCQRWLLARTDTHRARWLSWCHSRPVVAGDNVARLLASRLAERSRAPSSSTTNRAPAPISATRRRAVRRRMATRCCSGR